MRISPRWRNTFLTLRARSGVLCELKYQHWPIKQKLFRDHKGCQWRTGLHILSEKCNAQKSEILTNIEDYSYRRVHKRASCSAWVICRGCGVITCNTQPSVYLKILGTPNSWNSYSCDIVALDLFCSHCRRRSYPSCITFQNCANRAEECK